MYRMRNMLGTRGHFLVLFMVVLFSFVYCPVRANVSYDGKGFIINGVRRILISGSIHYPRSSPEMWPDLLQKAKDGGLDVIQTYVFWNGHEPSPGKYFSGDNLSHASWSGGGLYNYKVTNSAAVHSTRYNFEGRYDLVKFIKLVQQAGLFVHLRIGPYICAEWNFGGFPVWLKYIPGMEFRTDNQPFKVAMQGFVELIVDLLKSENLFEPQGGPIIMSQIENEFGPVEWEIGDPGKAYTKWMAQMALGLNTGVPWIMCKQEDAPDPIIDTCNGFYCENFHPNKPYKPKMFTEVWTGWYTQFGGPVPRRPAEDLAFAVTRFVQNNGSFFNYYMYHGGTNFGRTGAGLFVATSYDYDAPLDEYGLVNEPKYGHLSGLHRAIKLAEPALVSSYPIVTWPGKNQEVRSPSLQTKMIPVGSGFSWQSYTEEIASSDDGDTVAAADGMWEQINVTRDSSDYLWYMTEVNIAPDEEFLRNGKDPVVTVMSAGHALHVFINSELSGTVYGGLAFPKLTYTNSVKLRAGINKISLLSVAVGLPNVGLHFEKWNAGVLGPVSLSGLNEGTRDLTNQTWFYKVGMKGESLSLNTVTGSSSVEWEDGPLLASKQPLTWYKATFDAPEGNDPLALDMSSMGKGEIWVNGEGVGRHWPGYTAQGSCSSECNYAGTYNQKKCQVNCGQPSQRWYHVPRSWLKPSWNFLVVFEEWGGDPDRISMVRRTNN